MRTLRTSSIAAIVDRLRPLLHIDPITVLPPEITSEIFSYLTPTTLLEASRTSRAWRERALDSRLWRQKFSSEGWGLDMKAIRHFEQDYKHRRKALSRRAEPHVEQSRQKKRARLVDIAALKQISLACTMIKLFHRTSKGGGHNTVKWKSMMIGHCQGKIRLTMKRCMIWKLSGQVPNHVGRNHPCLCKWTPWAFKQTVDLLFYLAQQTSITAKTFSPNFKWSSP